MIFILLHNIWLDSKIWKWKNKCKLTKLSEAFACIEYKTCDTNTETDLQHYYFKSPI